MRHAALATLAFLVGACGASQTEYFRPTERQTDELDGQAAAAYDVTLPTGHAGEVLVSSGGAYRGTIDGRDRTLIHVTVEVENTSTRPMAFHLGETQLDRVLVDQGVVRSVRPIAVYGERRGRAVVAPGQTQRYEMHFALPREVAPQEVDAFRLRWSVGVAGRRYAQLTPFVEDERRLDYVAYPASYYYDPFYGPYWDPFYGHSAFYTHPYPYAYAPPTRVVPVDRPRILVRDHRSGRRVY